MRRPDLAEFLAAHVVLGSPVARAFRRVADNELSFAAALRMLGELPLEHAEHTRRVFAPLSSDQLGGRLELLLLRIDRRPRAIRDLSKPGDAPADAREADD